MRAQAILSENSMRHSSSALMLVMDDPLRIRTALANDSHDWSFLLLLKAGYEADEHVPPIFSANEGETPIGVLRPECEPGAIPRTTAATLLNQESMLNNRCFIALRLTAMEHDGLATISLVLTVHDLVLNSEQSSDLSRVWAQLPIEIHRHSSILCRARWHSHKMIRIIVAGVIPALRNTTCSISNYCQESAQPI